MGQRRTVPLAGMRDMLELVLHWALRSGCLVPCDGMVLMTLVSWFSLSRATAQGVGEVLEGWLHPV